jgi:hypothetical protein
VFAKPHKFSELAALAIDVRRCLPAIAISTVVSLDDFHFAAQVAAKGCVILGLAENRVVRLGECRKDGCSEVFDCGCLKCETDWLAIVFEQDAGQNAFDQGADVQPFGRGVLETTVVQVVPVDVDARS